MLPRIFNYGRYTSDNYGVHCLQVCLPTITFWFSYTTIVAFRTDKHGLVVCDNVWGPTTGKHLNWIDHRHHEERVPSWQFEDLLRDAMLDLGGAR